MASPKDAVAAEAVDREVPPPEKMAELRDQGPVSAAIADLYEDTVLDHQTLTRERARVKTEALVDAAAVLAADAATGPRGEIHLDVGGKTPAVVTGVHVDELGVLSCTVTHPGIREGANPFRFANPPVGIRDELDPEVVREDPAEAFGVIVAEAVRLALR